MTNLGLIQRLRQRIGGPKSVELPVSYYGKLPIYKDFLRENLAGKEAQAFKHWLDRGISHFWSAREATRGQTIEPHAFLLRFPGTGRHVVGCLWGSHDEGGLRFFPFSIFVSLPADRDVFPSHSVLEVLAPVIEAGHRWRLESSGLRTLRDCVQWTQSLALHVNMSPEYMVTEDLLTRAEEITVHEYTSSLWGEKAVLEWPALLAYLDRYRHRIGTHAHSADLAARFPSSTSLPLVLQTHFLSFIVERFDCRRDRPFQLFLPISPGLSGIAVFLRNLRSEDVFAFHPDLPAYEHLEDFRESIPRGKEDEVKPLTEAEGKLPLRAVLDPGFRASSNSPDQG